MPPMGFESTISVLERENTARALDHAATVIDSLPFMFLNYKPVCIFIFYLIRLDLFN
jgi:hypothetical protein